MMRCGPLGDMLRTSPFSFLHFRSRPAGQGTHLHFRTFDKRIISEFHVSVAPHAVHYH